MVKLNREHISYLETVVSVLGNMSSGSPIRIFIDGMLTTTDSYDIYKKLKTILYEGTYSVYDKPLLNNLHRSKDIIDIIKMKYQTCYVH